VPLITVEGLDGAGKTTLVEALAKELRVTALREPGGVPFAERIRDLVKMEECDPRTEALLFAAARAELCAQVIEPALAAGQTLIVDRFVDSSLAYQGGGRELGVETVRQLNAFAPQPDRTLLLRLEPEQALQRIRGRGNDDRFEELEFLRRVAVTYDALVMAEPERFFVIDASQPPEAVLAAAAEWI
jgi:dTMP kinase